jgi:DNA topoisomerase-1
MNLQPRSTSSRISSTTVRLQYVDDTEPGISRRTRGRTFQYLHPDEAVIRAEEILLRIRALAIPPAWVDVWICLKPRGHLQATGRDARGRKQYLYHPHWRVIRDEAKYGKLVAFAKALPRIRRRVAGDLRLRGLPRRKVLAAIIKIMDLTLIRVGNDEYARTNGSFGLTTMRDRHVRVRGSKVSFQFRGKSGINHEIDLQDPQLAAIVRRCQDLPGQELFQYVDETGKVRDIGSADVNDYLREVSGDDFTAKDFRTWAGTACTAQVLRELEDFTSLAAAKRNISQAIEQVARRLGNTKTVCRESYVHPIVLASYLDRTLGDLFDSLENEKARRIPAHLSPFEVAVLELLQRVGQTDTAAKPPVRRKAVTHSAATTS